MYRRVPVGAVIATALLVLAACSSTTGPNSSTAPQSSTPGATASASDAPDPAVLAAVKGKTVVLINGDNADAFFLSIWAGAKAEAEKYQLKFSEQAPNTYDYTLQAPLLVDAIAQKPDGIILSPDSHTAFAANLQTAADMGIPIVGVNTSQTSENDNPNYLSFHGSDSILLGQMAAEAMLPMVDAKAKLTVINSVPGNVGTMKREKGFTDTIAAKAPGITFLPTVFDNNDVAQANSMTRDQLIANPDLAGIYAVDAFTGQGVGNAVKGLNLQGKVKVVAIDALPSEIQLMKDGIIQALIAQQPYQMGVHAVDNLVKYWTGKKDQIVRSDILPPIIVTPANMNDPDIMNKVIYAANKP